MTGEPTRKIGMKAPYHRNRVSNRDGWAMIYANIKKANVPYPHTAESRSAVVPYSETSGRVRKKPHTKSNKRHWAAGTLNISRHLPFRMNATMPQKRTASPMNIGGTPRYAHPFPNKAYPRRVMQRKAIHVDRPAGCAKALVADGCSCI